MSFSSDIFGKPHPRLARVELLQQDKLPLNDITVMVQEMLDAGEIMYWGPAIHNIAVHLINCGLCKTYTPAIAPLPLAEMQ